MRADRITDMFKPKLFPIHRNFYRKNIDGSQNLQPDLMIVDSIQTLQSQLLESAAGTVSQIRECSGELIKFAKEKTSQLF